MKVFRYLFLICAASILAACGQNVVKDTDDLAEAMTRTFHSAEYDPRMVMKERRMRIKAHDMPGFWIYVQNNMGDEEKPYKQRVLRLAPVEDGTIIQQTFALKSPKNFENPWDTPEIFAWLRHDDLEQLLGGGCNQIFKRGDGKTWHGYTNPKTCTVFSEPRQNNIRFESEVIFALDYMETAVRDYQDDMTYLQGNRPGERLRLYAVKP